MPTQKNDVLFENNVEKFQRKNARASALLSLCDPSRFKFCTTLDNELNLFDQEIKQYLYSQEEPLSEIEKWVKKLGVQHKKHICIYGIGLGLEFTALRKWLVEDNERTLTFLEDDLSIIHRFLETERATSFFNNTQCQLFFLEDSSEGVEVIKSIIWGLFPSDAELVCSQFYDRIKRRVFQEIEKRWLFESSEIHAVLDEYTHWGIPYFRNFWPNLFNLVGAYPTKPFFNAFKGVPAICIAAGPSLQHHFERLKSLKSSALLISGGSAINALSEHGVMPHFTVGIDPNPTQYVRFRQNLAFEIPFFFRTRILPDALSMVHGPKLYLRGGDGYNISDWFEEKLHLKGKILGGGHSVANFCIEIAQSLGCNPIVLVGYDLSYGKNLEPYAPGVHIIGVEDFSQITSQPIEWQNVKGETIYSEWKWVTESQWISEFKQKHPKVKFRNVSDSGLKIEEVKACSFEEILSFFSKQYDFDGKIHEILTESGKLTVTFDVVFKLCSQMYDSLSKTLDICDSFLKLLDRYTSQKEFFEDADFIMKEQEFHREIAYLYILEVFDRMKTKLDVMTLDFYAHPERKKEDLSAMEMRIMKEHFLFLKEVAVCNQMLIVKTIQEQQLQGKDAKNFRPKTPVRWI